ncbi:MAG: ABC transporter ATP-binding protein [Clostridia bacterium]
MNSTIKTTNLNVGYDKKTVVSNVDIDGLKGQIICLLGPNGAGKSTILRTLTGLLAPVNGCVKISGNDIAKMDKKTIAKNLAVVLTDTISPYLMKVYELIAMGRTPYTNFFGKLSEDDHKIIAQAIQDVGAENLKDRYYSELSDGEKQKVMIARALVQEPELIVLDEPTSHLDIRHKIEVLRILRKLVNEKNMTVILSLHDIDLAMKSCQKILLINKGEIVAQGCPEDIITSGRINQLYNVEGAKFNELLGAVEIEGDKNKADVLVVAGNGTGANIFRALSKAGIGINSAILHENDIDKQVAEVICSEIICEKAFSDISEQSYQKAEQIMISSKIIIDTNFPVGSMNKKNVDLVKKSIEKNKIVFSLRDKKESQNLFGDTEKICFCNSINELSGAVAEVLSRRENEEK